MSVRPCIALRTIVVPAAIAVLQVGCSTQEGEPGFPYPTSTPTTVQPTDGSVTVPVEADLVGKKQAEIDSVEAMTVNGMPALKVIYRASIRFCGLLERVDVAETDSQVTIGIYVGNLADVEENQRVCDAIGAPYQTMVRLKAPVGNRQVIDTKTGRSPGT